IIRISSITYVWRSPLIALSFMFRTNEPDDFVTLSSSLAIGVNHSTYLSALTPPYVCNRANSNDAKIRLVMDRGIHMA
ncbi:hypothetical protein, partial [Salmonella enterica]|uniref:hypothetical protein n=1 Tax=Salmonella enterica TaxID=28901 RepID=UPI001C4DEA4A